MGTIIAQAPLNKGIRVSMPNCEWLIHEGSCAVDGTYKQMFSLYEFEKKMMDKSYEILSTSGHQTGEYFQGSKEGAAKRFIKRQLNTRHVQSHQKFTSTKHQIIVHPKVNPKRLL